MKSTHSRRYRRGHSTSQKSLKFKKDQQQEHTFFAAPSNQSFFKPHTAIQRKCDHCEAEDKQVKRMNSPQEEKKVHKKEDDKELHRQVGNKEEEQKIHKMPDKKEEKELHRTNDYKEEDKKLAKKEATTSDAYTAYSFARSVY